MKYKILYLFLFLNFVVISKTNSQDIPKWQLDIDEPIEYYEFIQDSKLLFITSGEYVWCYNAETGAEAWKMEVDGFDEEGISLLIGEFYLTNSDNKLQAYDAITGKLLWENEYKGIDQEDYSQIFFVMNDAILIYGENKLGIDLNTGKELYRIEFDFWGDLVDRGTYNYSVIESQKKLLVYEDSEICSLYDITSGKKLYSGEDYDINSDLIKAGLKWSYKDNKETAYLMVLDNGAVFLDLVNNKEVARLEFDIDGDKNVIIPTTQGAAIMGEEKLVHFNFTNHKITEVNFPFDDVRTLSSAQTNGKDILILGLGDQMAAVDLVEGKILWQTKEDDPQFEGYAHRYIAMDGDNILIAYSRARLMSSDSGTYIYLLSINTITGKVNYKTPVVLSSMALSDFTRGLTKALTGMMGTFFNVVTAGAAVNSYDAINNMMGYSNIGFEYNYFLYKDDVIFEIRAKESMMDPKTRNEPGEGFIRVNKKTGAVVYSTYFELCDGFVHINNLAPVAYYDNLVFLAGEEKLVGFNLDSGKIMWTLGEEAGFVADLMLIDDVLYTKFGIADYSIYLDKDDVTIKEKFSEDPFGFMAIDAKTGKILWKVNTEVDPSLQTPQFSLENYYDEKANRLYFADEQNVYALKLGRDGGKYDWQYNLEKNDLGEMEFEETYAVQESWIGSVPRTTSTSTYVGGGWVMTTTKTTGGISLSGTDQFLQEAEGAELTNTYRSWGNYYGVSARKCLNVLYGQDNILIIAPEGYAMLNTKDGSEVWKTKWDYDNKEVSYIPKLLNNSIVYCLDEELVSLDIKTGKKRWNAEEDEKSKYFLSPNKKFLYSIYDEQISAYPID